MTPLKHRQQWKLVNITLCPKHNQVEIRKEKQEKGLKWMSVCIQENVLGVIDY